MAEEIDIMSAFDKVFAQAETGRSNRPAPREGCYQYRTFDMCRNKGTVFGILVPDEKMTPIRVINNVTTAWIPYVNDEGQSRKFELKWCTTDNYKDGAMDEVDKELNTKIKDEIDKYAAHYEGKVFLKTSRKMTLFYYAISKVVKEDGNIDKYSNPCITTMIHTAGRFVNSFQEAIKSKTNALEDSSWMRKYFSRSLGAHPYITQIKTTRPQIGYEMSITFEELEKLAVTLDESHLESSKNIYTEYIDVTKYDKQYNERLYSILRDENSKADNISGVRTDTSAVGSPTIETPDLLPL